MHDLMKRDLIKAEQERLANIRIKPHQRVRHYRSHGVLFLRWWPSNRIITCPEMTYDIILDILEESHKLPEDVSEQVEIQTKYEGYIQKSLAQVEKVKRMEDKKIPLNIDYDAINSLASEAREKLKEVNPLDIAQASRISGVNPADISILLVYIEQGKIQKVD